MKLNILTSIFFMECIYLTKVSLHVCNFTPISRDEFHTDSELYHHHSNSRHKQFANFARSDKIMYNGPIRIYFDYTKTFLEYLHSKEIISNIINVVRDYFNRFLHVKRSLVHQKILVPRQCINYLYKIINGKKVCLSGCTLYTTCSGTNIPKKYLKKCLIYKNENESLPIDKDGSGKDDVDIVLIVDKNKCDKYYPMKARSCFHDKYDRPILGVIVICEGQVRIEDNFDPYITALKHEVIHALGFDATMFALFRDNDGKPIVDRDDRGLPIIPNNDTNHPWTNMIAKTVVRTHHAIGETSKREFQSFVMPKTLQEAKKHFHCYNLDGVDFEDIDPLPSKAHHFDELIYGTEIMTPISNGELDVMSSLTLAFLDDTGWYNIDYRYAESYDYAKDAGCQFTLTGCYLFMEDHKKGSIEPFCDVPLIYEYIYRCKGRDYYQFCNLTKRSYKMHQYIYFHELIDVPKEVVPFYYGAHEEAEYCPRSQLVSEMGFQTSVCYDEKNMLKNPVQKAVLPSYYGLDSECFANSIVNAPKNHYYGAACHKIRPINVTHFTIYFQKVEYTCIYGKLIRITYENMQVTIYCGSRIVGSRFPRSISNYIIYPYTSLIIWIIFISILHVKSNDIFINIK